MCVYIIYGYGSRHDVHDTMKCCCWFFSMCMHISCVDLFDELTCKLYVFFLGVLTYYVMLQTFICYCSYFKCL